MNSNFGDRIKTLRKQRAITQQVLADILGVTKTMVSAYETGTRKPSTENLMELALYFDVSMDWLFGNTQDKSGLASIDISQLDRNQQNLIVDLLAEFKRKNKILKAHFPNNYEALNHPKDLTQY